MPRRVTPLKIAIVASGERQKDIGADVGLDEASFSRIVNGLHCSDDLMQKIARRLGRSVEELFGSSEVAA
jgi:hypothetical protein